jgi:hypothetical protein
MEGKVRILSLPDATPADAIAALHPATLALAQRFGVVNALNALLSGFVSLALGCVDPASVEAMLRHVIAQLPALAALRKDAVRKSAN